MSEYDIAPYSEDAVPQAISPEGAEIANTYLANACSIKATSEILNIPTHTVSAALHDPMVQNYVNGVLRENGHRHMEHILNKLDDVIEMKWEELEEAEIGSNKDIADLLQMAHKMRMDMSRLLQADVKNNAPASQKNTQVNVFGEGKYGALIEKLLKE
jgi:Asp-tRNA(Asn)/Glu-tRNA(Gln) amidotransferase C subunit